MDRVTLTPSKATGACSRSMPNVYLEPMEEMTTEDLGTFLDGTDIDGAYVADLLSAMLTHERCGRHLYRACAERTRDPVLAETYARFGRETETHVRILSSLIESCGGDAQYVSPDARLVHGMDAALLESTFRLTGGVDPLGAETAMLDAVFLSETIDHANWSTLAHLVTRMSDGANRDRFADAVARVEAEEDVHLQWAQDTRQHFVTLRAEGRSPTSAQR